MFAIIIASVVTRAAQLSQRTLYWDDLVIPAYFSPLRLTGDHGLFSLYDGHLMPASALLQVGVHHLAPLSWWLPVCLILLMSLGSGLAWRPVLKLLLPSRPAVQSLAMAALCFSPFLMDAAGWWSAAINAYAWQLAMAGTLYFLLQRRAPAATLSMLVGLLFTEKSLTILPLVAALAFVLYLRRVSFPPFPDAPSQPFPQHNNSAVPRAGHTSSTSISTSSSHAGPSMITARSLITPLIVWVSWLGLYLFLARSAPRYAENNELLTHIPEALTTAIIPGSLGGPWLWQRWSPSKAYADTPLPLSIIAGALLLILLALLIWHNARPRALSSRTSALRSPAATTILITLIPLVTSLAYLAAILVLLASSRDSHHTSGVLLRSMHYYADWWTATILLVGAGALGRASRKKNNTTTPTILTTLFIISAMASTATWTWVWKDDINRTYLPNLRAAVQQHPRAMLQQQAPLDVLNPVVHPYNLIGNITGHGHADASDEPTMIDVNGNLTRGRIGGYSRSIAGNEPSCGTRITAGTSGYVLLDNPVPFGEWTWELNAAATHANVELELTTPNGLEEHREINARASYVTLDTHLRTRWVRVSGVGGIIKVSVRSEHPEASVCIGAGAIGPLIAEE